MILNPSISIGLFTGPVGSAFVSSFGPAADTTCVDAFFAGPLLDRQLSLLANSGASGGGKKIDPDQASRNLLVHLLRAEANLHLECWPEGIADLDRAIALDPGRVQSYATRGLAKARLGIFEEALADFDRAIAIDPSVGGEYAVQIANIRRWKESPVLFFMDCGLAKMKEKRFVEAVTDFDRALALDPNHAQAHLNRGISKGRLSLFKEAVADFDDVLRIDPDLAEAYGHRGGVKVCLGYFDAALADFERAIRIDPSLRKTLDREIASVRSRKGAL